MLAASLASQSSLTTTFVSNNGGSVGGTVFFDLQVTNLAGITVKQLDINTVSLQGELRVFVGASSYTGIAATPTAWTQVAWGQIDPAGINNPTPVCLGSGFYLPFGSYAIALQGVGISHRYTTPAAGVPLTYSNADVTIVTGAASNTLFGGLQFSPRIWNGTVDYEVGQISGSSCAYAASYGVGCNRGSTTWYEEFSSLAGFDLSLSATSPMAVQAIAAGPNGYIVIPGLPLWRTPTTLAVHDNDQVNPGSIGFAEISEPLQLPFSFPFPGGSTNVVHAIANGCLVLQQTSSNFDAGVPGATTLLGQYPRLAPLWCYMDPSGNASSNPASGIYFEVDTNTQEAFITWLDVADARAGTAPAGTTTVNVQCVLRSDGSFEFRYGTVVAGLGAGGAVTGWSRGGQSGELPDPGSRDVSSALPFTTNGPDNFALEHRGSIPRLGTALQLIVDRVETVAPLAFLLLGDTVNASGISLDLAGAPGCFVFTNVLVTVSVPVVGSTGNGVFSLAIPNLPTLIGSTLASQYVGLTLRNPLNVSTSNALGFTIGI